MAAIGKCVVAGLALALLLDAQVVRIPPSETGRNSPGVFTINWEPQGREVVGLQWDFVIPYALVVQSADIVLAKGAASAGKTITCAVAAKQESSARYRCVLVGNAQRLPNGPIVLVTYHAGEDVHGAPIRVSMENVLGVAADLQRVTIPPIAAVIRIR